MKIVVLRQEFFILGYCKLLNLKNVYKVCICSFVFGFKSKLSLMEVLNHFQLPMIHCETSQETSLILRSEEMVYQFLCNGYFVIKCRRDKITLEHTHTHTLFKKNICFFVHMTWTYHTFIYLFYFIKNTHLFFPIIH